MNVKIMQKALLACSALMLSQTCLGTERVLTLDVPVSIRNLSTASPTYQQQCNVVLRCALFSNPDGETGQIAIPSRTSQMFGCQSAEQAQTIQSISFFAADAADMARIRTATKSYACSVTITGANGYSCGSQDGVNPVACQNTSPQSVLVVRKAYTFPQ